MITINLSEEQAKILLDNLYWRFICGEVSSVTMKEHIAKEIFTQIDNALSPRSTNASELSAWRHESGKIENDIENWKRKNETIEESGL